MRTRRICCHDLLVLWKQGFSSILSPPQTHQERFPVNVISRHGENDDNLSEMRNVVVGGV
jgi:hypothetical protein